MRCCCLGIVDHLRRRSATADSSCGEFAPVSSCPVAESELDVLAASCDAQIRRTMSSAASSSRHLRSPLPWENKGRRVRGEVQLPAQLKMAGGVGEATCAACHLRGFMVVAHSRRFRRAQYPSKVPEISSPLAANQSKVPV